MEQDFPSEGSGSEEKGHFYEHVLHHEDEKTRKEMQIRNVTVVGNYAKAFVSVLGVVGVLFLEITELNISFDQLELIVAVVGVEAAIQFIQVTHRRKIREQ